MVRSYKKNLKVSSKLNFRVGRSKDIYKQLLSKDAYDTGRYKKCKTFVLKSVLFVKVEKQKRTDIFKVGGISQGWLI